MRNISQMTYNVPRIKSIAVENVNCFKKLTLKFSPGLNIVAAHKGTGKTTLISLLAGAREDAFMLVDENLRRGQKKGAVSVVYEPFQHSFTGRRYSLPYGPLWVTDFTTLKSVIKGLPKEHCLLVELDWLIYGRIQVPREQIFTVLSKVRCQVIATVSPIGLDSPALKGSEILRL